MAKIVGKEKGELQHVKAKRNTRGIYYSINKTDPRYIHADHYQRLSETFESKSK